MMDQDLDGPSPYTPGSMAASSLAVTKAVWYRRPWFLVTAVVVVMIGVSVVSDLPHHISPTEDASAQNASIKQINADLAPCNYAIAEVYKFYRMNQAGQITAADRKLLPKQLTDDQSACSFTSGSIYDLTNNFQALDTTAGKNIDSMHTVVVTWVTSDALAAIEAIMYLIDHPGNPAKLHTLHVRTLALNAERAQAIAYWQKANSLLGGRLDPVKLAILPSLS
jgi:hypothetical protein